MTQVHAYAKAQFSNSTALSSKGWKGVVANHLCEFIILGLRTIILLSHYNTRSADRQVYTLSVSAEFCTATNICGHPRITWTNLITQWNIQASNKRLSNHRHTTGISVRWWPLLPSHKAAVRACEVDSKGKLAVSDPILVKSAQF